MAIQFTFQKTQKPGSFKPGKIKSWLKEISEREKLAIKELQYIFVEDESLLKINREYLLHDTYTDIVTFDNADKAGIIEGDIFISLERVEANAVKFNVTPEEELYRVMAHGLLHLCGYNDKKEKDVKLMRKKEEECLKLIR